MPWCSSPMRAHVAFYSAQLLYGGFRLLPPNSSISVSPSEKSFESSLTPPKASGTVQFSDVGRDVGSATVAIEKLKQRDVDRARKPLLNDGGGLNLQVADGGSKSWLFRYQRNGIERQMGLGSVQTVSLTEARELARQQRWLLLQGLDPLEEKRRRVMLSTRERLLEAARTKNFTECAEAYIEANGAQWRNSKHRAQWRSTLSTYAEPVFGNTPVAAIDTPLVLKALQPIWNTKTETATRVRGRIERVLAWATTHGYRSGDNPARWRGHLDTALAKPTAVTALEHHAALHYSELPAFITALRGMPGCSALALEFLILCASRTGEVIGAHWRELDLTEHVWTIPGARMKAGVEHRVPLTAAARKILDAMAHSRVRGNTHLFPGLKAGSGLSNMAMLSLLRRMGCGDITTHGFRSTFRDWAAERTGYANHIVEAALAHTIESKTERAYRRTDLLEKRRRLMNDWAKFCNSPAAVLSPNVVDIRPRRAAP